MDKVPRFIRRTTADHIDEIGANAIIVLEVSLQEIRSQSIGSCLERLHALSDSAEACMRFRENLFVQVMGYDHDPRELPEIPEVRAFFAKLVDAWPHWMWFLSRDLGEISRLMSLLCEVKIHRANGAFGVEFVKPEQLNDVFSDLLTRGLALFRAFDIAPHLAEESANSAAHVLVGE